MSAVHAPAQGPSSPNDLLAAAGWDALPGKPVILRAGDALPADAQTVWFPLTAIVRVEVGEPHILAGWVDHRGAVGIGEAVAGRPSGALWVVAATGSALAVPRALVLALLDRADRFSRAVIAWLHESVREARGLAAANVQLSALQRVALLIEVLDAHQGSGPAFWMTQAEIARLTGVQRTTACGALLHLKKARVIVYSRTRVQVLDRPSLHRAGLEGRLSSSAP